MSGDSSSITVRREGRGPEVLLVHGGAGPEVTWAGLEQLTERFTLCFAYRRGYPPSPPPDERQDFAVDADDISALLTGRPHLVAHSYGGCGAALATARAPERVRSLTLIEPALDSLPGDPEMEHLKRLGDNALAHGLDADPAELREFLRIAGSPVDDGPLPDPVVRGVLRAHGSRSPYEAHPDLDAIRAAGVPALVASGGHSSVLDRACDALADTLDAARVVAPGAGHFVAAAPGFAADLERFLLAQSV